MDRPGRGRTVQRAGGSPKLRYGSLRVARGDGAADPLSVRFQLGAGCLVADTPTLVLLQSRPITTGQEAKEPVATPLPSQTDYVIKQLLATSKKKVQM